MMKVNFRETQLLSKMEIVQKEGGRDVTRSVIYYNLDAIISVGYRVNSRRATQFRIWATSVLKEYMTKASRWMTNASNREQLRLVTTTSVSCLSVSARSAPANAASGNR